MTFPSNVPKSVLLFPLHHKHIPFSKSAPLCHLVAVIEVSSVLVAAVCAEGELQAGSFGGADEILVGDVREFVDLDGDLVRRSLGRVGAQADDAVDARLGPELGVVARDRDGEKRRPSEDVDGLGGQQLLDEFEVARHEGFAVVDHGVDLPDGEPSAVGLGERERVHEDVVELVEHGLGEGLGPSGIDRLQAMRTGYGRRPSM